MFLNDGDVKGVRNVAKDNTGTGFDDIWCIKLPNPALAGFDETVNAALAPISKAVSSFIFFSVPLNGADIPLIVVWLIAVVFSSLFISEC